MTINIFTLLLIPFSFTAKSIDHAPLSEKHVHFSKNFIEENFKTNGSYDKNKIDIFLGHLYLERENLKDDIYETKVLEKIELDIKKPTKAREKGRQKAQNENSEMLYAYDYFLIPKIKNILEKVKNKIEPQTWDDLIDEFIRGYIPFFIPNGHRNFFPRDMDLPHVMTHLFKRYHIKKNNKKKIEANNLQVYPTNQDIISEKLGYNVPCGHYLSNNEILTLMHQDFDISLIDPGISLLWKDKKEEEKIEYKNLFPQEKQRVYFKKVIYRGHNSSKIRLIYQDGKKEEELKLKIGQEVHTELFTSRLFRQLGLNQDVMQYRDKFKIYLGDIQFHQFKSLFTNKYGIDDFVRYVSEHGRDEHGDWVVFEDILLETRKIAEQRVSPVDISSWDLLNRREYRSLLLLWGWVGLNNTKFANFKFLLKEIDNKIIPQIRMHDTGQSLGGPTSLRVPNNFFSLLLYERVNSFPTSFLKVNHKKNKIKINWNDPNHLKRYFSTTTWWDLKWMARKILALKSEDIKKLLYDSGMPKEVVEIFYTKLIQRRNEISKSFSLEKEYPPIKTTKLDAINIKDEKNQYIVKKGHLKQTYFKGKNTIFQTPDGWSIMIPKLLSFNLPVNKWREKQTGHEVSTNIRGIRDLKFSLSSNENIKPRSITTLPLGSGVEAIMSRHVDVNQQNQNANGKVLMYKIEDSLTIRFSIDSPLLRKIISQFKYFGADLSIKFYEFTLEHSHYEDTVKKAYFSSFNLINIFYDLKKFSVEKLKPLEMIRSYHNLGFDMEAGAGLYATKPVITNEISFFSGSKKIISNYFLRDQFGQLHVFKDKAKRLMLGLNFSLLDIDLFIAQIPFFRTQFGTSHFNNNIIDYIIELPNKNRDTIFEQLDETRRANEYEALKVIEKNIEPEKSHPLVKKNYQIESSGSLSSLALGALFTFNVNKSKEKSRSKVILPNNETKNFFRLSKTRNKFIGSDSKNIPTFDVFLSKRKRIRSIIEMESKEKDDFVLIVRTEDYYRTRDRNQLLLTINDLNRRFSINKQQLFYRNFYIPENENIKDYKKIYALTRTFIKGKSLAESLKLTAEEDLLNSAQNHFNFGQENYSSISLRHKYIIDKKTKALMKYIKKHLPTLEKNTNQDISVEKLCKIYQKIIEKLHIETYGLNFLKDLLGEENIFVMGEIAGIYPSFTVTQDLQQQQKRRFIGKSWGKYNFIPPIQHYLRNSRMIPPSNHIQKIISDDKIFGYLETALSPDIEPLYLTGSRF